MIMITTIILISIIIENLTPVSETASSEAHLKERETSQHREFRLGDEKPKTLVGIAGTFTLEGWQVYERFAFFYVTRQTRITTNL